MKTVQNAVTSSILVMCLCFFAFTVSRIARDIVVHSLSLRKIFRIEPKYQVGECFAENYHFAPEKWEDPSRRSRYLITGKILDIGERSYLVQPWAGQGTTNYQDYSPHPESITLTDEDPDYFKIDCDTLDPIN